MLFVRRVAMTICCENNITWFLFFVNGFALSFFREENPRHKKEKKMAPAEG